MFSSQRPRAYCRPTLFLVLLFLLLPYSVMAQVFPPWEGQNSVRAALLGQEGQEVFCEAVTVNRIAARNNPSFFVIQDPLNSGSRIVVLARVNADLRRGHTVDVHGTLQRLPNGELCISDAIVEGYVDADGRLAWIPPLPSTLQQTSKTALAAPVGPIPPSDSSLPVTGTGITGEVTATDACGASAFDTIASLLATAPPVLASVRLSCKPVRDVGEGYIVIGDDHSDTAVKIYTNEKARPGDRIVRATGEVHSEDDALVLYADSGPAPYFDPQAVQGSVVVARPGTTAYAATLPDAARQSGGHGLMSVNPPDEEDGAWVYLTGQVVTYLGQYYSYDIPTPGWVSVYNLQGVDRKPGIRVWNPPNGLQYVSYVGSIVDIMAKLDTKDGQRMLGKWEEDTWNAVDLTSSSHSVEAVALAFRDYPELPNLRPLGMNNRQLGGPTWGNNPGVSEDPVGFRGFYNVGNRVGVWGRVLESGPRWDQYNTQLAWPYQFDEDAFWTTPYLRIDDGAGVISGNSYEATYGDPYGEKGVIVFGANTYNGSTQVNVDDYVFVMGVSSVWKPYGSSNRYRCVWVNSTEHPIYSVNGSIPETTSTGTISGTVKLYDMLPNEEAVVQVCCSNGRMQNVIVKQQEGGFHHYEFTGVPKTVDVTEEPEYLVSAQSEGYKTRTYTSIKPWTGTETPRNLYLTRLRKIYVTTDNTTIEPCSGGYYPTSTVITATVVDSDRIPMQYVAVRFRTNKGSFSSGSIIHEYTPAGTTNSNGQVTATLYAVPPQWGNYDVVVEATDDSAPVTGDNPNDDPYKYDWVQLHDDYGQSINMTIIQAPADKFTLIADPFSVPPSQSTSTITATLTTPEGAGISGKQVTFTTTAGSLNPTSGTTNSNGVVTTVLSGVSQGGFAVVEAIVNSRCNWTFKQRCQVDFLQSEADDWPMFMHDVRHQGYSRFYDNVVTENLTLVWNKAISTASATRTDWHEHPTGDKADYIFPHPYIDSSPVHASGCPVIVGAWASGLYEDSSTTGYVKAFNATSGADAWRYPTTGYIGAVASTPCIADIGGVKQVYFGSMDGKVYCLNANTGAALWSQPYQTLDSAGGNGKILASPIVYNGRVYIGNESATIYCLNVATGALVWSYTFQRDSNWPDRTGVSSVAIGPTGTGEMRAYVGCDNGHVYCLSLADSPPQRVIWDYAGEDGLGLGCIESSPTVYAGNVYVGTSWYRGRDVVALDAASGGLLWYQNLTEEARAACAIADGYLYVGVDTGYTFHKIKTQTGEETSRLTLASNNYFVGSAALCSANIVFVGNDNHYFYALRQSDLTTPLSSYNASGILCSSPAISYASQSGYRWVYVVSRGGNGQGTLYAFRKQL